jgi:hypothetical protein
MAWTKSMRIALHRRLIPFGIDTRKLRKDRILLEQTIFPFLIQSDPYQRILFVGTAWYNLHYPRLFQHKEFWTLEIDPNLAPFGSRNHTIDSCTTIDRHFHENSLDCIILNGVFGFGLNDPNEMEQTCIAIHKTLKPDGLLILGYNTLPDSTPCPIDHIQALKLFSPFTFPPLNTHILQSDPTNQHWFQFLSKPTHN